MNKPNIFKSNKFHLDAGDVVHILIKDLTGTGVTIGLNDGEGTQEDSENIGFTTTLAPTTTTAPTTTSGDVFSDWYLPSIDELALLDTNLSPIVGVLYFSGGATGQYWSSTETSDVAVRAYNFHGGGAGGKAKSSPLGYVRAIRSFTTTDSYVVGDIAPGGGYVFYKNGDDYLECSSTDQNGGVQMTWSNITDVEIGATAQGTAVGTGLSNTLAIIGQAGHTNSAAKVCNDL